MAKSAVLGLRTKSQKENITVKVDGEVVEALKELEGRIEKDFPDLEFSRAAVVEAALADAVKTISAELDKRGKGSRGAAAGA
jgi:hypothetical protein